MAGNPVVAGATASCTMGAGVFTLNTNGMVKIENRDVLTMTDIAFGKNIIPNGTVMCQTPSNPAVASATAAALGVLTPAPCALVPAGCWRSIGKPVSCKINGISLIDNSCQLMCSYGGTINIVNAGALKVTDK